MVPSRNMKLSNQLLELFRQECTRNREKIRFTILFKLKWACCSLLHKITFEKPVFKLGENFFASYHVCYTRRIFEHWFPIMNQETQQRGWFPFYGLFRIDKHANVMAESGICLSFDLSTFTSKILFSEKFQHIKWKWITLAYGPRLTSKDNSKTPLLSLSTFHEWMNTAFLL